MIKSGKINGSEGKTFKYIFIFLKAKLIKENGVQSIHKKIKHILKFDDYFQVYFELGLLRNQIRSRQFSFLVSFIDYL